MKVIKASGEKQKFQKQKIVRTCKKAGASKKLARKIANKVKQNLHKGITTREILDMVLNFLHEENPKIATRYNLKKSMLALGPAGFIFEKFIKRLLQEYKYDAHMPEMVKGKCVKHEIDIIASSKEKEAISWEKSGPNLNYMIECKYHNDLGIRSGIKTVLYTKARFLDVKNSSKKFNYPWLISNTKFSNMAVKYSKCENVRLLGWKYPKEKLSLENLIEEKKLYPITILKSANSFVRKSLFSKDIITCKDFLNKKRDYYKKKTKIYNNTLISLTDEAKILLGKK